ncbi:polymorphic toxin-type HINT domain-containing protein [Clostridium sp. C8-1-8]|uniref:polymorphic toxin-type HINT domain-containing protein n=1 Tax=Clostridium sp. C8-1-8 TaxID=2698831 RepID=UPI00136A9CD9|nr:polymorphic toxin-type HINT domain-containing protein [Clostridium sp. C8-1-8]
MTGPISYKAHVENIGWKNYVSEGQIAGTVGQGLRVEAININRGGLPQGARIKYQVHVQDIGWMDYVYDGADAGTMGRSLRIEAMRMQLENAPAGYHIQYQVHVQDKGWMDTVSDGQLAGTTGESKRIEAFKINLVQDLIPRMNIDAPTEGQSLNSSLRVYGWSLHKGGVSQVKVYIDGNFVGNANTGGTRPDVKNAFPQYDNGENSGFDYNLDINSIKSGNHNIRIDSIGNDGSTISQNRNFTVTKDEARLNIDDIKTFNKYSDNLKVRGWSINPSGVKAVDILIDGKFKNYAVIGLLRRDVKDAYPSYPNADNSGFEYEIEVAELANGDHTVTAITRGNDGSYAQQTMGFSVNSSNSGSEVTGLTMTASFFGGIKDAIADNVQGLWKLITNLKQIPGLVEFAVKASMDDTEEHQMLQGMVLGELVDMSLKYSYGDRNVKARFFGRAVGEIIIALAGFKGIPKALEALKGVSKAAKLEGIIGEISKGAKAEEVVTLIDGVAEAESNIMRILEAEPDAVFEYITETTDAGKYIKCKTIDGVELEIPKNELSEEAVECLENGCFTGETLVETSTGLRRIDSLNEGDLVLSEDVKTGKQDYKKILTVYKKTTNELYVINIDGKRITTTSSHLFMMEKGFWKSAKNIVVGDKIEDAYGSTKEVRGIEIKKLDNYTRIYNLNVEDYHTYFVGNDELLVHNKCIKTPTSKLRDLWKAYTGKDSTGEIHHGLPEEFKDWFATKGLDVNSPEYFFDLPEDIHRLKIGDGIHTNNSPLGKTWNTVWAEFKKDYPNASPEHILEKLDEMANICDINKYKAVKK